MGLGRFYRHLTGQPHYKKAKKVLILEGGGMRGIFLIGVLQAFSDRGYFPWKLIIGSSAGAICGAAYTARQLHLARDAFFTELLSGKFINISNILRPERHILNLDWMVDHIIKGDEPIDAKKLRKSIPVLISVTDCRPYNPPQTIFLNSRKDDIVTALKATAAIPFLYRGFVPYKKYHLLDGGLIDPIPYQKAFDMGYRPQEILVVLTRKQGYRKREESFWIKSLYESYYKDPQYKYLVETLENRFLLYNRILDDLENRYPGIDVIYPPDNFKVDRLTRDEKRILDGFEMGIHQGKQFLKNIRD